jgi:hypothetical protein
LKAQLQPFTTETEGSRRPSASSFVQRRTYGFFLVLFFGAGLAVFFLSVSRPPIRRKESVALKGNVRIEVSLWLAAFRVRSTPRLLANLMTAILAKEWLQSRYSTNCVQKQLPHPSAGSTL